MAVDLSKMDKKSVAKLFDYAILPKNTREKEIREGCELTRKY
jgi:deoxyribose-phosphate aldolase